MAEPKLPDPLVQEIRHLLAVHCRDICFGDQAEGCDAQGQLKFQEKVFHGSAGYASVATKFMNGKGEYENAFIKVPIQNNREGNEERTEHMLQLKEILHCEQDVVYYVHERGFNRKALVESKGEPVTGRTIGEKALTTIANYKFALKFGNDFCNDGKLPSGKSFEDLCLHVREQMFLKFKGGRNNKSKKKTEVTISDMPAKYMFHGYMAYVLFSPLGLANTTLSCLDTDGKNCPKKGRKETRAKASDQKNLERMASHGSKGSRGVGNNDPNAMSALRDMNKNILRQQEIATSDEQNIMKQIDQVEAMIIREENKINPSDRALQAYEKRKLNYFEALDEVASRKKRLNTESERSLGLNNTPKKVPTQVEASTIDVTSHVTNASGTTPRTSSVELTSRNDEEDDDEEDSLTPEERRQQEEDD